MHALVLRLLELLCEVFILLIVHISLFAKSDLVSFLLQHL